MIELKSNGLNASFPHIAQTPKITVTFQRTLRIPDDGKNYPLPPGLGPFPLVHIDDYAERVPSAWLKRGGVLMPMWQTEALWLQFSSNHMPERGTEYPFAIKVATGKINAVTGEAWSNGLHRNPQDYLVTPKQPWLDGYCVEKGIIRQFVAMPLGEGFTAEEQITGLAEFGGLQIEIFPMRKDAFDRRFPINIQHRCEQRRCVQELMLSVAGACEMGLAPGGRMRQEIAADPYSIHDWDLENCSRCFVHLVNSATWKSITGLKPPTRPFTARDYTAHGLPWFDFYDKEMVALEGSTKLANLDSVAEKLQQKQLSALPDNESVNVTNVVNLRGGLAQHQVREGEF